MGGGLIGGGVGNIVGGLAGKRVANKTNNESQRALNQGTLGTSYTDIENLLLGYDELVGMGRINVDPRTGGQGRMGGGYLGNFNQNGDPLGTSYANSGYVTPGYEGLSGNQSRFGRGLQAFEEGIAASDPLYSAYKSEITKGIQFDENGLPADISRGILQGVRSSSSSRGLLDSGTAGLEEVAALVGGKEQFRNERLAQVNQFLQGTTNNYISALFPGINNVYGNELNRAISRSNAVQGAAGVGANIYATGANSFGGGGGGGGGSTSDPGVASLSGGGGPEF